ACVPRLEVRDGEGLVGLTEREVVRRFAGSLESPEPTVAILQCEIRLSEERVRPMAGFIIASPTNRRRPDTVFVGLGVIRRRCRHTGDIESRPPTIGCLRFGQFSS